VANAAGPTLASIPGMAAFAAAAAAAGAAAAGSADAQPKVNTPVTTEAIPSLQQQQQAQQLACVAAGTCPPWLFMQNWMSAAFEGLQQQQQQQKQQADGGECAGPGAAPNHVLTSAHCAATVHLHGRGGPGKGFFQQQQKQPQGEAGGSAGDARDRNAGGGLVRLLQGQQQNQHQEKAAGEEFLNQARVQLRQQLQVQLESSFVGAGGCSNGSGGDAGVGGAVKNESGAAGNAIVSNGSSKPHGKAGSQGRKGKQGLLGVITGGVGKQGSNQRQGTC